MNPPYSAKKPPQVATGSSLWPVLLAIASAVLVLIALLVPRPKNNQLDSLASTQSPAAGDAASSSIERITLRAKSRSNTDPAPTAEEIVAAKVGQFGKSRREIVERIARRLKKNVPPEVEKFFEAVESGRWEEIDARWKAMRNRSGQYENTTHAPELDDFWPAVLDAYGVAEQAHLWPAQKLLDYGNAILDSLRPGMVYVGGTDPGRWIPELLNETSDGERHIIVTQNAFADGRYLDYVTELYGDRFGALTKEDSERAFQEYIADAQTRLQHDQQFPTEAKQVLPGEDIQMVEGRTQVSGQIAVMAINERLMRALMEKNPGLSFAMETSFPFASLYPEATTLGPIMELRARDDANVLTAERAQQAADYWCSIADQAATDPESGNSEVFRKTYSKLAAEHAALLQNRQFTTEADQAYRSAIEIWPGSPEAVFRYVNLLVNQSRIGDAIPVTANAVAANPENPQFRDLLKHLEAYPKP